MAGEAQIIFLPRRQPGESVERHRRVMLVYRAIRAWRQPPDAAEAAIRHIVNQSYWGHPLPQLRGTDR